MVTQTMVEKEPLQALKTALDSKRQQIQERIISWATDNCVRYPWRQSGKTPYEVTIGEAWLRQTSPPVAVMIYQRFIKQFMSLKALYDADENDLVNLCHSFGLTSLAKDIKLMIDALFREGKGDLPANTDKFAKISGMEGYRIRSVFCFGYGMPIAIIDNNISRMLRRLFKKVITYAPEEGLMQTIGESLLPFSNLQTYNRGLLDIAEIFCQDPEPLCARCPVNESCDFRSSR